MSKNIIKTRFAPSPTGQLHLGNLRTALFSALFAKHQKGAFLLRIEDTDASRNRIEYEELVKSDLHWLGLDWDEGPEIGGNAGPYRQSERSEIYNKLFDRLLADDFAYPCFCSQETLTATRKAQLASGQPPRYPGTCARLTSTEIKNRIEDGQAYSLRFRVPPSEQVIVNDLVMGEQHFNSDDIGDFVIRRSNGTPAFFFSNAIDDALMGVTHVLRGADHISNSPRQMLLLRALGLQEPQYGHLSLIVGNDGSPLSKRHNATGLDDLRAEGYLPLALLNHLARLGHSYREEELMDLESLGKKFDLNRLGRSPARHEVAQLDYWQKQAIASLNETELVDWAGSACELVPDSVRYDFITTIRDNILFPKDVHSWAQALFGENPVISQEGQSILREISKDFFEITIAKVDKYPNDFKAFSMAVREATGLRGKALFMPLRVALTGNTHGPEMARIYTLLGPDRARRHLLEALRLVSD